MTSQIASIFIDINVRTSNLTNLITLSTSTSHLFLYCSHSSLDQDNSRIRIKMAELIFKNTLKPANVLHNAIIICTEHPDKHKKIYSRICVTYDVWSESIETELMSDKLRTDASTMNVCDTVLYLYSLYHYFSHLWPCVSVRTFF
jgi:hypothetical protein